MDNIFDVVLQGMRDSFPKLNWKLGSVIRTLLVEPLKVVNSQVEKYTKQYEDSLNLEALVNSPAGKDTELNLWMARLGIAEAEPTPATGTVAIILTNNINMTVVEGARFTWNDEITLYATRRTDWGPVNRSYKQLSADAYLAEIEVTTLPGAAISLNSGSPVNWDNAPEEVSDIYIHSPVSGGHSNGPQDKAAAIRALLAAPTACGEDSIRAAILRQYGNRLCDAAIGPRIVDRLSTVSLYLKQSSMPVVGSYRIVPTVVKSTTEDKLRFKVDTEGVIEVLGAYTNSGIPVSWELKNSLSVGTLGDSGSYRVYEASYTNPTAFEYSVEVKKYADATAAVGWLNSTQWGLPFKVVTKLPAFADISLQINTGGVPLSANAKNAICEYINGSRLNDTISDNEIKSILTTFGYSVTGTIIFVGKIQYGDKTTSATSAGSLSLMGRLLINDVPVAMYCNANNITSY